MSFRRSRRRALLLLSPLLISPALARADAPQFSAPAPASPPDKSRPQFVPQTPAPLESESPTLRATLPRTAPVIPTASARPALLPPPNSFGQTPVQLYPWLENVALARPDQVKLKIIGQSSSGGSIVALEIAPPGRSPWQLKRLVVVCRQHGNEPEATASGARLIYHWLNPRTARERNLAAKTALLIVPIANPDGAAAYKRHTARGIDMNRDWGVNQSVEVRALTRWIAAWKPNLVIDNHQWLPSEHMPPPMAEASGGADAKRAARTMSARTAQRGYALSARSRWGLDTLCHRFWGQRFKIPAVLLETRHLPAKPGARTTAIEQAETGLWGAAESIGN